MKREDMKHEESKSPAHHVSCLHVSRFHVSRIARIHWSTLVFLVAFTVLLIVIVYSTLIPGMEAARGASPVEKRGLAAWFRLLLLVLLFILFAGVVLTFRFGRLFFPRETPPR